MPLRKAPSFSRPLKSVAELCFCEAPEDSHVRRCTLLPSVTSRALLRSLFSGLVFFYFNAHLREIFSIKSTFEVSILVSLRARSVAISSGARMEIAEFREALARKSKPISGVSPSGRRLHTSAKPPRNDMVGKFFEVFFYASASAYGSLLVISNN